MFPQFSESTIDYSATLVTCCVLGIRNIIYYIIWYIYGIKMKASDRMGGQKGLSKMSSLKCVCKSRSKYGRCRWR